jgi:hypothetical protein
LATKITIIKTESLAELEAVLDRTIAEECPIAQVLGDKPAFNGRFGDIKFGGMMNADDMPEEVQKFLNGLINEVREDQHRAGLNATAKPRPTSNPNDKSDKKEQQGGKQ